MEDESKMSYATRGALLRVADVVVVGLVVVLACTIGLESVDELCIGAQAPTVLFTLADAFIVLALAGIVVIGVLAWRIFGRIGKDDAFCERNAADLDGVALAACLLCALALVGCIVFFACTSVLLALLLLAALACFVFAIAANALAHLTRKAAAIQRENDLTV